ncbi:ankyrin repeat and SOCS box protein 2-like [Macrobrachium nipponense]|uniref:ankyrin repeat and SOCS box protein 2-like n=1 Tax=Macrobrachium nipponense TaxID=159736 RepID=UPI0030C8BFA0
MDASSFYVQLEKRNTHAIYFRWRILPLDVYKLFVTDEIFDLIVIETNRFYDTTAAMKPITRHSKMKAWKPVTKQDIEKFFGIFILMGLNKQPTFESYWSRSKMYGVDLIKTTMARNKFELILRFIHFADNSRSDGSDRLFKLRPLIQLLSRNFKKFTPGEKVVIDESKPTEDIKIGKDFSPIGRKRSLHVLVELDGKCRDTFPSGVTYCVERAEEGRDSILCTAALLGHTNCVRILVEYREADVEELGSASEIPLDCCSLQFQLKDLVSGVSPLWCAASNGHYWVVDYLLSKGANPNGETSFNGTPLQAACALGYFEIVRLLEEHGAYIEAADNRAVTCLMLASFGGHLEIVKYLLEVGADVNSKNIEGESALHACAKAGHLEVMKLLLEHNARTGPDYSGESCLKGLDPGMYTFRFFVRFELVQVQ